MQTNLVHIPLKPLGIIVHGLCFLGVNGFAIQCILTWDGLRESADPWAQLFKARLSKSRINVNFDASLINNNKDSPKRFLSFSFALDFAQPFA